MSYRGAISLDDVGSFRCSFTRPSEDSYIISIFRASSLPIQDFKRAILSSFLGDDMYLSITGMQVVLLGETQSCSVLKLYGTALKKQGSEAVSVVQSISM